MTGKALLLTNPGYLALTEGAIVERIRRLDPSLLDPFLAHAPLVYSPAGRSLLADLHRQYIEIGRSNDLPILVFTDTWRANFDRLKKAGMADKDVNGDCVRFLREIIQEFGDYAGKVYLGGLIGCKGDAYKPDEALPEQEASSFHSFQINALAAAGVDFLFASTVPSLPEAAGMAAAMASTGVPYVISFVLNRRGLILDGAPLHEAVSIIDAGVSPAPLFYMANCCHPSFHESALKDIAKKDFRLLNRIIGLQANTSAREAHELDNLGFLDSEEPGVFADLMMALYRDFGARILGGCCGTGRRHIAAIAERFKGLNEQA